MLWKKYTRFFDRKLRGVSDDTVVIEANTMSVILFDLKRSSIVTFLRCDICCARIIIQNKTVNSVNPINIIDNYNDRSCTRINNDTIRIKLAGNRADTVSYVLISIRSNVLVTRNIKR